MAQRGKGRQMAAEGNAMRAVGRVFMGSIVVGSTAIVAVVMIGLVLRIVWWAFAPLFGR